MRKRSRVRQRAAGPGPEHDEAPTEAVLDRFVSRSELQHKARNLQHESYFETLQVPFEADARAVEIAYHKQLYLWHPDRLPPDLRDAYPLARAICARIAEARRVLLDPVEREAHRAEVAARPARAHEARRAERERLTADLMERAEAAVRRRAFLEAERLLRELVQLDGERARYLGLLAWARAKRIGLLPPPPLGKTTRRYAAQLALLDRALAREPDCEKCLYFRAELLKRSGYLEEAIEDFRACVRVNPRNVVAAREVHAHEMARLRTAERGLFARMLSREPPRSPRRTPKPD